MREKDRELKRRRQRRNKRLKIRHRDEALAKAAPATGSKRSVKKPAAGAEPAVAAEGDEVKKKPAAKKAPAAKKPAKKAAAEGEEHGTETPSES